MNSPHMWFGHIPWLSVRTHQPTCCGVVVAACFGVAVIYRGVDIDVFGVAVGVGEGGVRLLQLARAL